MSRVRLELSLVRSDLADFVSFKESAVYCMSTLTMLSMSTVQSKSLKVPVPVSCLAEIDCCQVTWTFVSYGIESRCLDSADGRNVKAVQSSSSCSFV